MLHIPLRYEDRTRLVSLDRLRPGVAVLTEGRVVAVEVIQGRRRSAVCRITNGASVLFLRFFHYSARQLASFAPGQRVRCFGEVRPGPYGPEMIHPEVRRLTADEPLAPDRYLTPVYPTADGVRQQTLRAVADEALRRIGDGSAILHDRLLCGGHSILALPGLHEALRLLHRPLPAEVRLLPAAQRRLAVEELLAHRMSLLRLRMVAQQAPAPPLRLNHALDTAFTSGLAFSMTAAQRRVNAEIDGDLRRDRPMLRLLQGDVGSGKTVIAARASLAAVSSGWQAAVMAPTELLAEQHARSFEAWLGSLNVVVERLTGRAKGQRRAHILNRIAAGEAGVVIGTHALFQQGVEFHRLGLVIIDEQHRFGVHQRLALRNKGIHRGLVPHQLIMTATPIPRTRAMVEYADLDLSVLDELPPGRTPVKTTAASSDRRQDIIGRIAEWVLSGRQAYWVCSLIDESEVLQCQAAEKTAEALRAVLPQVRVGLLHGRMKSVDKEAEMQAFVRRELDLLVATTVIEVGVDVPNAGLMIIENAERFGLAQLHQLRGRVGRGPGDAFCVLLYQAPLSQTARERLDILRRSNDGFEIAEKDWELRGSGELLGTRQTGLSGFRVAQLPRDSELVPQLAELAERVLAADPAAADFLIGRWIGESLHYAEV